MHVTTFQLSLLSGIPTLAVMLGILMNAVYHGNVNARFSGQDARFSSIEARMNSLASRFDARFNSLDVRFNNLEVKFDTPDRKGLRPGQPRHPHRSEAGYPLVTFREPIR